MGRNRWYGAPTTEITASCPSRARRTDAASRMSPRTTRSRSCRVVTTSGMAGDGRDDVPVGEGAVHHHLPGPAGRAEDDEALLLPALQGLPGLCVSAHRPGSPDGWSGGAGRTSAPP